LAVITSCTATVVWLAIIDPAFRHELLCSVTPKLRRSVDCPRREKDFSAFRYGMVEEAGIANGDAHCDRNRWVKSESLIAYAVE